MSGRAYHGGELALFEKAVNWKAYWATFVSPWLKGQVLEVGAGAGANTSLLSGAGFDRWVCLEPDASLLAQIPARLTSFDKYEFMAGTIADLNPDSTFDSIIYIDVLEHLADDRRELLDASQRLKPDGTLIVLSPAHPWLFSPFDRAIGHYRRYTKSSLRSIGPARLKLERLLYLDSAGLLASAANRFILRQRMPSEKQILTWDRMLVPPSVRLDHLLRNTVGRSVLAIWRNHMNRNQ